MSRGNKRGSNRKNQNGISLINIVLIIFILIAIIIIGTLFVNEMKTGKANQTVEDNLNNSVVVKKNATTNTNNISNNVALDGNILSSNQTASGQIDQTYKLYFYNQLNSNAKSMYNSIIKNVDSLKNGYKSIEFEVSEGNVETDFQSAWDAICLDRPEIFYVDTKKLTLITQTSTSIIGKTKYKYVLQPQEGKSYFIDTWVTADDVKNSIDDVDKVAHNIAANATGTTYNKIKYIHDAMVEKIEYDQTNNINNSNIYGALIKDTAVCEGYAETFKVLMDKVNIPCVIVYGNGTDSSGESEYHAWNEVLLDDGKWYAVDTTWDDPIIIGGGKLSNTSKYKNFLKGSKTFFKYHENVSDVSGTGQNFKYPELSENDYNQ